MTTSTVVSLGLAVVVGMTLGALGRRRIDPHAADLCVHRGHSGPASRSDVDGRRRRHESGRRRLALATGELPRQGHRFVRGDGHRRSLWRRGAHRAGFSASAAGDFCRLDAGHRPCHAAKTGREKEKRECHVWPCLLIGAAVGVLTGFLGVGGGFLIVPALVLLAGVETKAAIGSSLAIIALNAVGGLSGQLQQVVLDWPLTLAFTGLAMLGMLSGLFVASKVPDQTLARAFGWLVIVLSLVIVLWQQPESAPSKRCPLRNHRVGFATMRDPWRPGLLP